MCGIASARPDCSTVCAACNAQLVQVCPEDNGRASIAAYSAAASPVRLESTVATLLNWRRAILGAVDDSGLRA